MQLTPSCLRAVWCAALVAAWLAGDASRASADPGAVIVSGKASQRERAVAASAARAAARSVGWTLVETPIGEPEVAKIVACLKAPRPWECAAPLVSAKGIRRLIVMKVDPDRSPDGKAALSLTEQVVLEGAEAGTGDARFCAPCVDESLTRIVFDLTKRLIEEAAAGTARTTVTIETVPPGAWITFDNTNVGLTNRTYATFPGRHVIIVQRDGYETETRAVDVKENQNTPVSIALREKDPRVVGGGGRRSLVPAIVVGAGVLAAGTGLVLQLTKEPPPVGEPQPKRLVSAPGIGLMIGGGIAVGVGVYLWSRTRGTGRRAPASAPAAVLTPGGGVLGWTGSF